MKQTKDMVKVAGNPLTLLGETAVVGMVAPDFTATDKAGKDVKLSDFKGKRVVISVFPSIDTPVCATQTRHFNKMATGLGADVVVLTVSKDLPFALGRFCGAEGIDNVHTLSDYKESEFGQKYGFLIQENKLLARGVVVVGADGVIKYVEYVDDLTHEPNYDRVLSVL